MNFFKVILSAFFPNICAACGAVIDEEEYFCDYCFEMLEKCQMDKICIKCGLPKKKCDCTKYALHFDGCVSPFFNSGVIKKALYSFKFRHNEKLCRFFAENMALMVKQSFVNLEFDYITYVPMKKARKIVRGYNQSFLLANELSKILFIPLGNELLKCNCKKKTQHLLSGKERFKSIKNIFSCDKKLYGKKILLVDDIKTSGATLDECAKRLFAAGADSVYCVTAAITDKKSKKG